MNKRILGITCVILLSCQGVQAQKAEDTEPQLYTIKGNHEVAIGYGVLPLPVLAAGIVDLITFSYFSQGEDRGVAGPLMLNYMYGFEDRWSTGGLAVYSGYVVNNKDTGALIYRNDYFSFMPRLDYHYSRNPNVDVYSSVAIGATYLQIHNREENDRLLYAFHINAIGVRFGKKIGGFVDLGFGMNGLLNAGVSLRL